MNDHDPEFSRRTAVAGATAWLLYNVAEQQTSTAWAAGQDRAAPPHAGNPKFAEEATRLAIESVEKGWGGPFGAVIAKDGEIIGRGQNRVLITGCPVYHAEVTAMFFRCSHGSRKSSY